MTSNVNSGRLISQEIDNKDAETSIAQSCKGCLFAEVNSLNQQYGCKSGRLRQYNETAEITWVKKKYEFVGHLRHLYPEMFPNELSLKETNQFVLAEYHDGELIAVSNEFSDKMNEQDEIQYAVINDRYCNMHRSINSWSENLSDSEFLKKVRAEITIKASVIIYFNATHSVEDLRTSIQSALAQGLQPVQIVVLNNQNDIAVSEVLKQELLEYPNISWTNSRSLWGDGDIGICFDDMISQDILIGAYFLLIHSGTRLPNNIISKMDTSLNDKLERWMCLVSEDILVVQTKLARILDGFQEVKPANHDQFIYGLEEKIKWFANHANKNYFVKELKDVLQ